MITVVGLLLMVVAWFMYKGVDKLILGDMVGLMLYVYAMVCCGIVGLLCFIYGLAPVISFLR